MRMHSRRWALRLFAASMGTNAVSPRLPAGIPAERAVYRGGSLTDLEPSTPGLISTRRPNFFVFSHPEGDLRIPYEAVNSLEYGLKAGRRLALAVVLSPVFLLSKKRRHYLTIGYRDEADQQHAAVFELGKRIVRSTLAALEARTGLLVDYEDERARQAARR